MDETLISLPIPLEGDNNSFPQLFYDNLTYQEILNHLRPNSNIQFNQCQLDPDIFEKVKERPDNWKACFGQS